jgi:uncharacterized protein (TIGR02757 family)
MKRRLEEWYRETNRPEFIERDPVQFPHRFSARADIEIAAFLASAIAWGRRDLILRSAEKLFALLGPSPYRYVMEGGYRALRDRSAGRQRVSIHRTFFEDDLKYFCRGFKHGYEKYGSLEKLFASAAPGGIWEGIALFRDTMAAGNHGHYTKHIADPRSSSACKRINLSLRWLVRREGPVDLGLWKSISPSALYIPLDLHVGRVARRLGLLDPARKANDRKAVITLTEKLREFCPEDPARYDLALFGAGVGAPGH